jgi:hypothetical protein
MLHSNSNNRVRDVTLRTLFTPKVQDQMFPSNKRVSDVTLRTLFITAGTFLEYGRQCRCMEFQGGTCSVVTKQTDFRVRLPLESLIFQSDNLMVLNDFRVLWSFFSLLQVLH